IWRRLQDSDPVERFLSLLEAICRNKIADANERRFRSRRQPSAAGMPHLSIDDLIDPDSPGGDRWVDSLESQEPSPDTAVLQRERLDELWMLLERLPDSWRLAVT